MKSPELDVRYVARLARLELSDAEATAFQAQLDHVLGYIAALDRVDVTGVEATLHGEPAHNVTRPDAPRSGLTTEQALANAPATSGAQFLTVRVVD